MKEIILDYFWPVYFAIAIVGLIACVVYAPKTARFDYEGHSYIKFSAGEVVHDPDCKSCL